jgi:uncharacterized membrane protein
MGIQAEFEQAQSSPPPPRSTQGSALQRTNGSRRTIKNAPRHASEIKNRDKDAVTSFLGWFSIGLGIAEVLAPDAVARLIGVDERRHRTLLRAYGVRELAAGVGILTRPKPTYWVWNRVIGDTIDLASLGRAMNSRDSDESRIRKAMMAVAGVTVLDIASSMRLTSEKSPAAGHDPGSFQVEEESNGQSVLTSTVTVNRPVEEVYAFWKDPRNYAGFMDHIDSVQPTTGGKSKWVIKSPAGMSVEWDAETVVDTPNEMIRWRSTEESSIENRGTVRFRAAPGGRGTIVTLEVEYKPKGGPLGANIGKLFAAIPKTQLTNDLRRFKQLIEIGEVVLSDATAGRGTPHPAQPSKETRS